MVFENPFLEALLLENLSRSPCQEMVVANGHCYISSIVVFFLRIDMALLFYDFAFCRCGRLVHVLC